MGEERDQCDMDESAREQERREEALHTLELIRDYISEAYQHAEKGDYWEARCKAVDADAPLEAAIVDLDYLWKEDQQQEGEAMAEELTDRQREVLEFIRRYIIGQLRPPTAYDITEAFSYSLAWARKKIKELQRKGYIEKRDGHRNIRVPDLEEKVATALEEHARRFSYPGMEASVERYFVKVEE